MLFNVLERSKHRFLTHISVGSQPSKDKRSFRYIAIERACSGDAVHSRIFFAQYMRRNPCIFPSNSSWRYNTPRDVVSMHWLGFTITAVLLRSAPKHTWIELELPVQRSTAGRGSWRSPAALLCKGYSLRSLAWSCNVFFAQSYAPVHRDIPFTLMPGNLATFTLCMVSLWR